MWIIEGKSLTRPQIEDAVDRKMMRIKSMLRDYPQIWGSIQFNGEQGSWYLKVDTKATEDATIVIVDGDSELMLVERLVEALDAQTHQPLKWMYNYHGIPACWDRHAYLTTEDLSQIVNRGMYEFIGKNFQYGIGYLRVNPNGCWKFLVSDSPRMSYDNALSIMVDQDMPTREVLGEIYYAIEQCSRFTLVPDKATASS